MLTKSNQDKKSTDYRDYLMGCFQERKRVNPRYSWRAFARDVDFKSSSLSLVLNKKRELSPASAAKIAQALGLTSSEFRHFLDLVHLSRAKNDGERQIYENRVAAADTMRDRKPIQADIFQLVSDWYHAAIMELTYTEGFRSDVKWIAKRLDVSEAEISGAIERLNRVGLLVEKDGVLSKKDRDLSTETDIPSSALRNMTRQLLHKALVALETQNINERDFGTITFSGSPTKIAKAKKIISQARREISQIMEKGTTTEVYSFTTQLFKVSK